MVNTISLKQNHLFRRLYQKGNCSTGRYVVVYCRKNNLQCNRLGITASTKVGNAVVRNRVRRWIRESYRLSESRYLTGYDIVIVARTRAANAGFHEIRTCLLDHSDRLNLLQKESADETAALVDHPVLPV